MRRIIGAALGMILGIALASACDDGIGVACEKDSDCADGLICDVHDGVGTCQEEHGHETDGEDTEHDHGETDHDHGETDHDHGETDHDHGETS